MEEFKNKQHAEKPSEEKTTNSEVDAFSQTSTGFDINALEKEAMLIRSQDDLDVFRPDTEKKLGRIEHATLELSSLVSQIDEDLFFTDPSLYHQLNTQIKTKLQEIEILLIGYT